MRSYRRQSRQTARQWLRWLAWGTVAADDLRVTWALWIVTVAILCSMCVAQPASAAPIRCRYIAHGQICYSSITGQKLGRCDRGYWLTAQFTCKKVQP